MSTHVTHRRPTQEITMTTSPTRYVRLTLLALVLLGISATPFLQQSGNTPAVAPFSRQIVHQSITTSTQSVVGLYDLQTILFQWSPYSPSADELAYVQSSAPPMDAVVTANGFSFSGTADAQGVISILVPTSTLDLDGGTNDILYECYDAQGNVLMSESFENWTFQ